MSVSGERVKARRATSRLWLVAAWAILTGAAAFVHGSNWGSVQGGSQAFARGSYAPLTQAERFLDSGRPQAALDTFKIVYLRARYEGQPNMAERVRFRIGSAGRSLAQSKPDEAWSFLEAYSLLAADFSPAAEQVEDYCLQSPTAARSTFEYHLLRSDGRTFWGEEPLRGLAFADKVKERLGQGFGKGGPDVFLAAAKSQWPNKRYSLAYHFGLYCGPFAKPAEVEWKLSSDRDAYCVIDMSRHYAQVKRNQDGTFTMVDIFWRGRFFNGIIVLSDDHSTAVESVIITRRYQPLLGSGDLSAGTAGGPADLR
jgi:hypothetical protein